MELLNYSVKATDELVLILDCYWMPLCITTVREGVKKLFTEGHKNKSHPKVRAINSVGEPVCWEKWIDVSEPHFYKNQPYIQSVNSLIPVPTILLTTAHFYHHSRKMPKLSLLYKKYKGICQICGEHKSQDIMTLEHIYPKSFGGPLDWYNITITCQPCNTRKGQIYPDLNYKGEELTGTVYDKHDKIRYRVLNREEWVDYIFKNI